MAQKFLVPVTISDPIRRYTLPRLWPYKNRIQVPDLEAYCRTQIPQYSFQHQSDAVFVKQKSDEWLRLRRQFITCSNFGSAVGNNQYKSINEFLKNQVWPETDNPNAFQRASMQWGTDHEPRARDEYCQYVAKLSQDTRANLFHLFDYHPQLFQLPASILQSIRDRIPMTTLERLINEVYKHPRAYCHNEIEVIELGFCIDERNPWLGGSPDGIICRYDGLLNRFVVVALLEIKCPSRKVFYDGIPPQYMDQVQGFMNMFDLPWCHFVTWIPGSMRIEHIDSDRTYWITNLFPKLERFYFDRLLPCKVQKEHKLLEFGRTVPVLSWDEIEKESMKF
jgi:hypothetical protein